jgi:cyclic beta-1,2-glucan synthetase
MAWFAIRICHDFAPLCRQRGEDERGARYEQFAARLAEAANSRSWDGHWFLRGYYDDGTSFGGHESEACQIDLNAQTWAVLADAAPRDRLVAAMKSVLSQLADTESRVLRLLAPPFDRGDRDPGYIQGYPPGVRENGGQYNHAAVWAVWAAADLGWRAQAREWFDWINPIARSAIAVEAEHYALEPYAVAGDIYYAGALTGRGGWSWYTGTAPWLYRVLIERLLGLERRGTRLRVRPCLPEDWPGYRATLRVGASSYAVQVQLQHGLSDQACVIELDGRKQANEWLELVDDGQKHDVVVRPARAETSTVSLDS